MTTTEIITIIALILGPVAAVIISLIHQTRSSKTALKQHVFNILMAHRKAYPPPHAIIEALNMIDVAFSKNKEVRRIWRNYYDLRAKKLEPEDVERIGHTYLELLSAIASDLGYKIPQIHLDQYYYPQIYGDQMEIQGKIQQELLRVLQNTAVFLTLPQVSLPQKVKPPAEVES